MIIKKTNMINEKLIIKDGTFKRLKINVKMHVDDVLSDYNSAQAKLKIAEEKIRKNPTEFSQKEYGEAVINIFNVVFGEKDTQRILKFYENRYAEMLIDIFPFVQDKILPNLQKYVDVVENAKKNRK